MSWRIGVIVAAVYSVSSAQSYTLARSTIGGGGAVRTVSPTYLVSGTIGQPDAGLASGGSYTLRGGFWSKVPGCSVADIALPFGVVDLADVDAFIDAFVTAPSSGAATADLVPPIGIVDLSDVDVFVVAFLAGCP